MGTNPRALRNRSFEKTFLTTVHKNPHPLEPTYLFSSMYNGSVYFWNDVCHLRVLNKTSSGLAFSLRLPSLCLNRVVVVCISLYVFWSSAVRWVTEAIHRSASSLERSILPKEVGFLIPTMLEVCFCKAPLALKVWVCPELSLADPSGVNYIKRIWEGIKPEVHLSKFAIINLIKGCDSPGCGLPGPRRQYLQVWSSRDFPSYFL